MSTCPTVKIKHATDPAGYAIINASDLTSDHVLFDAPARETAPRVEPEAADAPKRRGRPPKAQPSE